MLIVVLPGIGGSVLARPGEPERVVWGADKGHVLELAARPARLSLAEWPVLEPVGLTRSTKLLGFTVVPGYERLLTQLAQFGRVDERGDPARPVLGADVVVVPYDFRRGVVEAAERLDAVVSAHFGTKSEAERAGRVVVLGHSLGGLVARYWMGAMGRWPWCRALLTVGTPHRGAPKALDLVVNGVRVAGVPLHGPTRLLREWPSVTELLPRYRAVRDTSTGRLCYPHDLPCEHLGSAAEAYRMHCAIEDAWKAMPRGGPEMKVCLGWSHATPDHSTWDGRRLEVHKRAPDWLDRTGWERDFGDGTVPAVSAVPIELSHHNRDSFVRLRDRHVPMAGADGLGDLLRAYLERRTVDWIRGDNNVDRPPALGLDLDDLYGADLLIPLTVLPREVDLGSQPVWASVTPVDGEAVSPPVDVRLEPDSTTGRFAGVLPALRPGLYEVTVSARAVPEVGDLSVGDTIAVIDPAASGGASN